MSRGSATIAKGKKKGVPFSIDCSKPVDDKIMEIASLEKFLQERIKVGDCIGSAFNAKGVMQCPNYRKVEKGPWMYANGSRSLPEFNVEDWVQEEDIYDVGGYSEMSFGVHWCPFTSLARPPSFEDAEFSSSSYHDRVGQQGYFAEPTTPAPSHPCPYVTYFGPINSSSSSPGGIGGVSDSANFSTHWNTNSSISSEVPSPYGFPVDPQYHGWDYHSPPRPPPQHFYAYGAHMGNPTQSMHPPATARTSRANGLDVNRPRPLQFMRPGRRPGRGIASGMGSTSSSSDQVDGNGFIRFNIWERDPYLQSQQAYQVNQMDREPSIWTSTTFNEGSGNFHQRHGDG
ncbi:unnamed protein product [Cochlearia groenlandica]